MPTRRRVLAKDVQAKVTSGLQRISRDKPGKVQQAFAFRYGPPSEGTSLRPDNLSFAKFIVLVEAVGRDRGMLSQLSRCGIPEQVEQAIGGPLPGCWWDYYISLCAGQSSYASELWKEFCDYMKHSPPDVPIEGGKGDREIPSADVDEGTPQHTSDSEDGIAITHVQAAHPSANVKQEATRHTSDANPSAGESESDYPPIDTNQTPVGMRVPLKRPIDDISGSVGKLAQRQGKLRCIEHPCPMANTDKVRRLFPDADIGKTFVIEGGLSRCMAARMYGYCDGSFELEIDLSPGSDALAAGRRAAEEFQGFNPAISARSFPKLVVSGSGPRSKVFQALIESCLSSPQISPPFEIPQPPHPQGHLSFPHAYLVPQSVQGHLRL